MSPNNFANNSELEILREMALPQRGALRWYALQIQSKIASLTSGILLSKGYETLLPLVASKRHWSDRVKIVEIPAFPGYLFCRFDVHNRLPILMTPGVVSIVGAGRLPIPLEDDEIAAIKLIVRSGLPAKSCPFLSNGSRVYIERGPLAGVEGILTDTEKANHLIVSITLLQRSLSVEVDRNWVRLASTNTARRAVYEPLRIYRPLSQGD